MKNLYRFLAVISISFVVSLSGCGDDDCLSCDVTITWDSFGGKVIQSIHDDELDYLLDRCDWWVHKSPDVGNFQLYEIASCGGGVIFVFKKGNPWAWNLLSFFVVSSGWTGSTAEGIRLGASQENFLAVYPYFYHDRDDNEEGIDVYYGNSSKVVFKNDRLIWMSVGWSYYEK